MNSGRVIYENNTSRAAELSDRLLMVHQELIADDQSTAALRHVARVGLWEVSLDTEAGQLSAASAVYEGKEEHSFIRGEDSTWQEATEAGDLFGEARFFGLVSMATQRGLHWRAEVLSDGEVTLRQSDEESEKRPSIAGSDSQTEGLINKTLLETTLELLGRRDGTVSIRRVAKAVTGKKWVDHPDYLAIEEELQVLAGKGLFIIDGEDCHISPEAQGLSEPGRNYPKPADQQKLTSMINDAIGTPSQGYAKPNHRNRRGQKGK